jgi:hypothetical protein
MLWTLSTLAVFSAQIASISANCGYVDVGTVSIRMGSCYVQCQEVSGECWDERFTCDDDGNLQVTFYRDADENCGGFELATVPAAESVEAYSCTGTSDTCTTFHYVDNAHNPDNDECGFLQMDVELVAEACFTTDGGLYMRQNCDDAFTVTYCSDAECTQDCVDSQKNVFGLDGDHCMDMHCFNVQTGETVNSLFLKGTRKYSVYNNFKPTNWTITIWIGVLLTTLVAISVVLQCKMYYRSRKGGIPYHPLKQIVDSDTEMEKLAQ